MNRNNAIDSITLDRDTPVPLYHQLIQGIRGAIMEGRLKPDDKLPPIHQLASEKDLTVATVSRAFSELAREGLVISRRGVGTLVAQRGRSATEILINHPFESNPAYRQSFYYKIIEGLKEGYNDPDRCYAFSHLDNWAPAPHEILEIARIRQVDGMVIYRPSERLTEAVRLLSSYIPTVTLFYKLRNTKADAIIIDPAPSLRALLKAHLDKGARRFAYVGRASLTVPGHESSPYRKMYEEFQRFTRKAGIKPFELLAAPEEIKSDVNTETNNAAKAPKGSVLFAATPNIANVAALSGRYAGIITYTEFSGSLDMMRGRADVIYMGIEAAGRKAADLLKERRADMSRPERTEVMQPEVYAEGR